MAEKPWKNPYLFDQAAIFTEEYLKLECQFEQLWPVARAFYRNMNRVRGLGLFPVIAVATATISECTRIEAIIRNGVPLHDPRISYGHPDFDPALFAKIDSDRMRLMDEWNKSSTDRNRFFWVGATGLNQMIDANEEFSESIQSTMAAMLTGLWTAFESLAQDTWLLSVNTHPKPLADRVLKTLEKEDQQKFLPGKMLSDADYNLQNCMGDILLRKRSVDFQFFSGIRDAYKIAFSGQFEPIFEEHQSQLSELEAMRNLFVHKGGVIDRKFIQRMGAELKDKLNCSLCVTGQDVADKANIVVDCSTKLIKAVDKWLMDNS